MSSVTPSEHSRLPFQLFAQGYFEQMVQQNSVMGVFGYYGWGLEDHLRSMQGEPAVFYWWEPTLLILQLDTLREPSAPQRNEW
eukprot:5848391-Amphidinium_carterae.1